MKHISFSLAFLGAIACVSGCTAEDASTDGVEEEVTSNALTERKSLDQLSETEQKELFKAIGQYLRTQKLSVPVDAMDMIVPYGSSARVKDVEVNIVAAHHAIDHNNLPEFFSRHRTYMKGLEAFLAPKKLAGAPNGKLPFWEPTKGIPAPFLGIANPPRKACLSDGENMISTATCDWMDGRTSAEGKEVPLAQMSDAAKTSLAIPADLQGTKLCALTVAQFRQKASAWHNDVHNTVSGVFGTYNSPAAPIFWAWHTRVDRLWEAFQDCKKAAKSDAGTSKPDAG